MKKYLEKNTKLGNRTTLYKSNVNCKQSTYKFLASRLCQDNEIMVFLDGDDWLKHPMVLHIINKTYQIYKPWVTYGNYEIYNKSGRITYPTFCKQVSPQVIKKNNYRKSTFCTSHLKTCMAWLYKIIPIEYLLDPDGKFLSFSTDVAEMRCLIELAGPKNKFIPNILYVYNRENSNLYSSSSAKRKNNPESIRIRKHIRNTMPPLKRTKKALKLNLRLNKEIDLTSKFILIGNQNNLTNSDLLIDKLLNPTDLNPAYFYLLKSNSQNIDIKLLEIPLRYMINLGIEIFILDNFLTNNLINNLKGVNLLVIEKIVVLPLLEVKEVIKTKCLNIIATKNGLERFNKVKEGLCELKFGERMVLAYHV